MPPRELVIAEHDLELGYIQGWFRLARIEDNRPVYVRERIDVSHIDSEELGILVENNIHWEAFFAGAELNGGDEFMSTADVWLTYPIPMGAPHAVSIPREVLRELLHNDWAIAAAVPTMYRLTQRVFYESEDGFPYIFRVGDTVRLEMPGAHPAVVHVHREHYQWLLAESRIATGDDALTQAQTDFVTRNADERWVTVSEGSVVLAAVEGEPPRRAPRFGIASVDEDAVEDRTAMLEAFLDLAGHWDLSSEQMELIEAVLTTPALVRVVAPPPTTSPEPIVPGPSSWARLLDEPLV
jgi:hypothetical protein